MPVLSGPLSLEEVRDVFVEYIAEQEQITFQSKSAMQKSDCINHDCVNESILETVYNGIDEHYISIRCCENSRCKAIAIREAKEYPLPSF